GAALADIAVARSHPQALAQSRSFLEEHRIEARAATNTARAARDLAAGDDPSGVRATHAAIASERAAAIYGLDVLARDVQRSSSNTTRFVVLGRAGADSSPAPTKVMLAYTTANEPGALHRTLGLFAELEVNLTRLESRPTRDTPWEYDFFVDCERPDRAAFDDALLGELVAQLGALAQRVRVLGAFRTA
ncbi:MAG: ACT domain-containing protein, partial [Thermoleophilia bacterium]|nr:ACT domain-containing protein [Thermoleophilia bacterium]